MLLDHRDIIVLLLAVLFVLYIYFNIIFKTLRLIKVDENNLKVKYYNQTIFIKKSDKVEHILYSSKSLEETVIIPSKMINKPIEIQEELLLLNPSNLVIYIFNFSDMNLSEIDDYNLFQAYRLRRLSKKLKKELIN